MRTPWHFKNWSGDAPGKIHNRARGANKHYPTDAIDNICKLAPPIADNAVLFLWVTSTHLPEALRVMQARGFTYRSIAWWWTKISKNGKPRMGMGYMTRQVGELCLYGTHGKPPRPKWRGEPAYIEAPRGVLHSQKPDEQYDKIARLFPDYTVRLEMYARHRRAGWDVFGNEVDGSIQL